MLYNKILQGDTISLRMVELSDCNENYYNWMNDKEVNQYMETRWAKQTDESIKAFVQSIRQSDHSYLFAIVYNGKHVGNIKLGPIHPIYKHADISYFIGDKSAWGKGVATEAILLVVKFAFEELKLNKLQAGAFEQNKGSQNALLKAGFVLEGVFRKKAFLTSQDNYCDIYEYSILASEYKRSLS